MEVSVGISNHHVHLTNDDFKILFGDIKLEIARNLTQPGQFASNLTVNIKGPKGLLENLRVLGPNRNYTQVEVSKTDCYKLGIDAPVRDSGDLKDACIVTIIGPEGQIQKPCAIIADRHIHVDKNILKEKGLEEIKEVSVKIPGEKSGIINHVRLKETETAYFELHLDTDDGNAFLLKQGDIVEIIL